MRHYDLPNIALVVCIMTFGLSADLNAAQLGNMQVDKVLFLGNSITCCNPNFWGLSASTQEKDYVHILARTIQSRVGCTLRLDPVGPEQKNADGSYSAGDANIVNIADIFERGYATYPGSKRLEKQLAWQPNVVILQFGENILTETFDSVAFESGLRTLVTEIKESSDPEIFVTGFIIGSNSKIDAIKQEICREDPTHRVFVDLSEVFKTAENIGAYNHPSDQGMTAIADTLFNAMVVHSVPEPSCAAMLFSSSVAGASLVWIERMHGIRKAARHVFRRR